MKTGGRGNWRPIPRDFPLHMNEPTRELKARYRAGDATVRRWRDLMGVEIPKGRTPTPVVRTDRVGNERLFISITQAARHTLNGSASKICAALRRGGASCGYEWRYAEGRDIW